MKLKQIALGLLATAPLGLAHHSFAMFELTKDVTYEGTVVEYRWENPHTHIIVKVDAGAGEREFRGWSDWDMSLEQTYLWFDSCEAWTTPRFFGTRAATPSPSPSRPSRMCML